MGEARLDGGGRAAGLGAALALTRVRRAAGLILLTALVVQACASGGPVAEGPTHGEVRFASLDAAASRPATMLDGYLFRPGGEGRHPALVFLHGCGGLLTRGGQIHARESDWAARLAALGYVVLIVDSFSPRNQGEMCSQSGFKPSVYLDRPKDLYGALRYLQAQSWVRPDRIGVMGWSQGGGAILFGIRAESLGRPAALPQGDFRAAVAFYPGSCRDSAHRAPWTSAIPLLVLLGENDNWTPLEPCKTLVDGAVKRGSPVEMHVYPGAYHDFDWPNLPMRSLTAYRTSAGVVPITAMDPAARADALQRVPAFLAKHLRD